MTRRPEGIDIGRPNEHGFGWFYVCSRCHMFWCNCTPRFLTLVWRSASTDNEPNYLVNLA